MSRLTRDGTAEPVSRDQILRHARGQGNVHFPCSADHEQDWQPYPVDPYSAICDDHTYIHTYIQRENGNTMREISDTLFRVLFSGGGGVVIPFVLGVRLVDAPAGVVQEEGRIGFLHLSSAAVLASISYREKDSAVPFPRRPLCRILCTHITRTHAAIRGSILSRVWSYSPNNTPVLSICPLHTDSGCRKERRVLIGPWWPVKAAPVWNYLDSEQHRYASV